MSCFNSANVTEKIAGCLPFEDKIVCYLSFLLYIMTLWLLEVNGLSFSINLFVTFVVDIDILGIFHIQHILSFSRINMDIF